MKFQLIFYKFYVEKSPHIFQQGLEYFIHFIHIILDSANDGGEKVLLHPFFEDSAEVIVLIDPVVISHLLDEKEIPQPLELPSNVRWGDADA